MTAVRDVESHAVLLPDLQGDAFPDLLIATLPEDQVTTATHTHTHNIIDSFNFLQWVNHPTHSLSHTLDLILK